MNLFFSAGIGVHLYTVNYHLYEIMRVLKTVYILEMYNQSVIFHAKYIFLSET